MMKRFLAVPALLFSSLGLWCCSKGAKAPTPPSRTVTEKPGNPTPKAVGTGRILLEAEDAQEIQPLFRIAANAAASGNKCIEVPGDAGGKVAPSGKDLPGHAKFVFTVKHPGHYHLWGRAFWLDGCGNSFTMKLDDGDEHTFGNDGTYERWHWIEWRVRNGLKLDAGKHTLLVKCRESGTLLDQILLTTVEPDDGGIPQGIEAP